MKRILFIAIASIVLASCTKPKADTSSTDTCGVVYAVAKDYGDVNQPWVLTNVNLTVRYADGTVDTVRIGPDTWLAHPYSPGESYCK